MTLRYYQQEAIDISLKYFRENKDPNKNPLIIAPTGTGKSHMIAGVCKVALNYYPETRILILAHRKELIEQNSVKLDSNLNFGLLSAGLGKYQIEQITLSTIGTAIKRVYKLGKINLVIIDEAHLVPKKNNGMYRDLINKLRESNPRLRIAGFTATAYRLDSGSLVGKDSIFTDVAYEIPVNTMIEQGYICPIVGKQSKETLDTSKLKLRGGEFLAGESQSLFMPHVEAQCHDLVKWGKDRHSWILFCSGVDHAKEMAKCLREKFNIKAESITGDMNSQDRRRVLEASKSGEIQAITNCDVLTTGYDNPRIDLVGLLRPTQSTGLYVQMVGRGFRMFEGKDDCLILDFGGNILRHGPVDDIEIPKDKTPGKGATELQGRVCRECQSVYSRFKDICPDCKTLAQTPCFSCGEFVAIRTKNELGHCPLCLGNVGARQLGDIKSADVTPLAKTKLEDSTFNVSLMRWYYHRKVGKPDSVKISFYLENKKELVNLFLCPEHGEFTKKRALIFLRELFSFDVSLLTEENTKTAFSVYSLIEANQAKINKPYQLKLKKENGYLVVSKMFFKEAENCENQSQVANLLA